MNPIPQYPDWIDAKTNPPTQSGHYIIHAPSADPEKPFITMAWYDLNDRWTLLPKCWCDAITHWTHKPNPPKSV